MRHGRLRFYLNPIRGAAIPRNS